MTLTEIVVRVSIAAGATWYAYRRWRTYRLRPVPASPLELKIARAEKLEMRGSGALFVAALLVGVFPRVFATWWIYPWGVLAGAASLAIFIGAFLRSYWEK